MLRRLASQIDRKQVITAVVASTVTAALIASPGLVARVADMPRSKPDHASSLADLSPFVPAQYRSLNRQAADLDGDGEREVIVTTVGQATDLGLVPGNLLILSWDRAAGRWTVVLDAANSRVGGLDNDRATAVSDAEAVLIPQDKNAHIRAMPFHPDQSAHQDLAISVNLDGGTKGNQVVAIVSFRAQVARVLYYRVLLGIGTASVSKGHGATMRVDTEWQTVDDAVCCPARNFTFKLRESRLSDDYYTYETKSDNRTWIGAWLLTGSRPRVVAVVPGSPAASVLRFGDEILGISGNLRRRSGTDWPAVFHDAALAPIGSTITLHVMRDQQRLDPELVVGSRSDRSAQPTNANAQRQALPFKVDDDGGEGLVVTEDASLANGLVVHKGDRVIAINGAKIEGLDDLESLVTFAPAAKDLWVSLRRKDGSASDVVAAPNREFLTPDEFASDEAPYFELI